MRLINTVLIKNVQSFNVNNNYCERYNSVHVKFIGGKQCNFVQRSSYKSRCEAAAVYFNNKRTFHSKINKVMTHRSCLVFRKEHTVRRAIHIPKFVS
jgi:hypothetical protein